MWNGNMVRNSLVILGLWLPLTLALSACGSMSGEGSSEPIGEEMYGGDNRDEAPVHQEKMRERRSEVSPRSAEPGRHA
jgi:hypothetical protein